MVRPALNSAPIRTCYGPGRGYRDTSLKENKQKITEDITEIIQLLKTGKYDFVVYPEAGVGTGIANLP